MLCNKCNIRPRAIDEGDGRELDWCKQCIRDWVRRNIPVMEPRLC